MSQRLTIAIPESLYERLQKVKQDLNISGVCQEALKMAITLTELKTNSFDREKLIERLRMERKALLAQTKEKGFKFGLQSAQYLSYQDFQRIEHSRRIGANLNEDAFEQMCNLLNSYQSQDDSQLNEEGLKSFLPLDDQNKALFVEGWIDGVLAVWNDIKDQVIGENLE